MRFLIDAQLPPALARMLNGPGHEGIHVADVGLLSAPDSEVWDYAIATGSVLITKDEDFAALVARADAAPAVVWLRVGNTSRSALLSWFDHRFAEVIGLLEAGERLIEIR